MFLQQLCVFTFDISAFKYRVQQKHLTILQHSCEWNCWHEKFVFECPSSETQSISVAMERWPVERRDFTVETYFKYNDSVVLAQRIFRGHLSIFQNDSIPSCKTLLLRVRNFRESASATKKKTFWKSAFT
jgi:hypothetical protein